VGGSGVGKIGLATASFPSVGGSGVGNIGLATASLPSVGGSGVGKIGLASEKAEAEKTTKRKHATRRNFIDDI
jgi:hypothetical protein